MERRHKEPLKPKHARKSAPTTFGLSEQSNAAKRQRTSIDRDDIFIVTVRGRSPHPQTFGVETLLFTSRSGYLARCLAEDPHMTVVLKGQEPEVLKMYADCVKFGTDEIGCLGDEYDKSLKPKLPNATQEEKQKTADAVFVKLIDLYLLARYLEDGETAHTVIDHIVHLSDDIHMIPSTSVDLAYSRTEKGDRLRQLMCDFWIYETAATGSKRLLDQVHDVEAKRDIGLGLLEFMAPVPGFQKSVAEDWFNDKCHYHDHSDGARCDWKGFN